MPKATGYAALAGLTSFRATQWFTKSIATLVDEISRVYGARNEVVHGVLFSHAGGTLSATAIPLDFTAGALTIGGTLNDLALGNDKDLFTVSAPISGAIWSNGDGEDDTSFSIPSDDTAYITIIATNSDGAGSTSSTLNLVAVIAGSDNSSLDADHLTTAEINTALAASSGESANYDHSGCSWCHVAQLVYADTSGSSWTATITDNRNNSQGA